MPLLIIVCVPSPSCRQERSLADENGQSRELEQAQRAIGAAGYGTLQLAQRKARASRAHAAASRAFSSTEAPPKGAARLLSSKLRVVLTEAADPPAHPPSDSHSGGARAAAVTPDGGARAAAVTPDARGLSALKAVIHSLSRPLAASPLSPADSAHAPPHGHSHAPSQHGHSHAPSQHGHSRAAASAGGLGGLHVEVGQPPPYRASLLTALLAESFGGSATCTQSPHHLPTISPYLPNDSPHHPQFPLPPLTFDWPLSPSTAFSHLRLPSHLRLAPLTFDCLLTFDWPLIALLQVPSSLCSQRNLPLSRAPSPPWRSPHKRAVYTTPRASTPSSSISEAARPPPVGADQLPTPPTPPPPPT